MPVAGIGPVISAVTGIGGAILAHRGQNRALQGQEKAQSDALQFARENEQRRRFEYDQAQALARQRSEQRYRQRMSMLEGLGFLTRAPRPQGGSMTGLTPMTSPTLGSMATQSFGPAQPPATAPPPAMPPGGPAPRLSTRAEQYPTLGTIARRPYGV